MLLGQPFQIQTDAPESTSVTAQGKPDIKFLIYTDRTGGVLSHILK